MSMQALGEGVVRACTHTIEASEKLEAWKSSRLSSVHQSHHNMNISTSIREASRGLTAVSRPRTALRQQVRHLQTNIPRPAQTAFAFDIVSSLRRTCLSWTDSSDTQDGVLKHGRSHILPGATKVLDTLSGRSPEVLAKRVPFLLMTNGGGQTEDERLKALQGDFGMSVSHVWAVSRTMGLTDLGVVQQESAGPVPYAPPGLCGRV
jgi:hypothetical protein